jgi:hypothetical protein
MGIDEDRRQVVSDLAQLIIDFETFLKGVPKAEQSVPMGDRRSKGRYDLTLSLGNFRDLHNEISSGKWSNYDVRLVRIKQAFNAFLAVLPTIGPFLTRVNDLYGLRRRV